MITRVRFLGSVTFRGSSYAIGDEAAAEDIPKNILNPLLKNKLVEGIEFADEGIPAWPLKTPPKTYLEEKPAGANADLARRILGIS